MMKKLMMAFAIFVGVTGSTAYAEKIHYSQPTFNEGYESVIDYEPTKNAYRITADYGGRIDRYIADLSRVRQEGEKVIVDGPCLSACTLILAMLPRESVCSTPFGLFGFHSAWYENEGKPAYAKEASRLIWNMYPKDIQNKLIALNWTGDEHPEMIYVQAQTMVNRCD
jgi:hypothetical protein